MNTTTMMTMMMMMDLGNWYSSDED